MFDEITLRRLALSFDDPTIATMHGCDRTNVGYWRKKFGIPAFFIANSGRPRSILLDVTFFSTIDTEPKAYILGLLSADGYVHADGKSVAIALQERDGHILEEMCRHLQSTAVIREKRSRGGYSTNSLQKVVNFCSKELVRDLAKYGIIPRKSASLTFPDIPQDMERHYLRGLWDGDGNVSLRNFSLIGTQALLDGVVSCIYRQTGMRLSHCPHNETPRIVGYRRDKSVLKWIYGEAAIVLHRKRDAYLQAWT